ncbi:hypothetical protein KUF57_24690 [Mycolicibacterium sp. PAM1]|uniref:hypothetical protein n=1 Tax=Mycolicibacterium sp. PAM1 TaxID=2853535 RepID=UPI001C3CE4AD|nr:hypothetical protein [Mycolicibacterium sp. PAM1]MBV5246734.1 hypothetical protein [Mycolicibacterium sp. PAM1]
MSKTTEGWVRVRKVAAWGAVIAAPTALLVFTAGTASADRIAPDRTVNSGQGTVSKDATFGDVRGADDYLHAQGEVRDSMIAVPGRIDGTRARGFRPSWSGGPGMGTW